MSLEPVNPDDPQLTAYALGELSASEAAEFAARLKASPLAQSELAAMSDLSSMLTTGLQHEWESRMPEDVEVNFDDPKYTAFALNELSDLEKAEVEAELAASPSARKEMDSMSGIMSMLSTGLKNEWETQLEAPKLESLPSPVIEENNVVTADFGQSRRAWMGVAAAAVALLGAAFTYFSQPGPGSVEVADWGSGSALPAMESSVDDEVESVAGVVSAPGVHVPQLFLADEVDDVSELNLAVGGPAVLDASYLDAREMPRPVQSAGEMQMVPVGYAPASQRIDSYLPQPKVTIENADLIPVRHSRGLTIESFSPQASSETVVDRQIRLAAEFQGVQIELEQMLARLPQGSKERKYLEMIVERNSRALSELKYQFAE